MISFNLQIVKTHSYFFFQMEGSIIAISNSLTQAQGNPLFTCAALHLQALSSACSEPAAGAAETHLLRLEGTGPP